MLNTTIIYIHGFGSIGDSYKGNLLKEHFSSSYNVFSPTFSYSTKEAVCEIKSLIDKFENVILVGTSLGGFYADYFNTLYNIPAVIINPLVEPRGVDRFIGENINYYTKEKFTFTKESFNYLLKIKKDKEESFNYYNRVSIPVVLLAEDDDLLDYKLAKKKFENCDVRVFPTGGHRFTNSKDIIRAVEDICKNLY